MSRVICRASAAIALVATFGGMAPMAGAGDDHKVGKVRHLLLDPFRPKGPELGHGQPTPLVVIGNRLDVIAEGVRDDGLVVLKQPDVWGQARMTKYRREFEEQMAKELENFQVILSGRIARLDAASLDSQTALALALAGSSGGSGGGEGGATANQTVVATTPTTTNPPVAPAVGLSSQGLRFTQKVELGTDAYDLGLEPTVVLDQKKRFLDALNQIRRVNLGDDIADSAGYGLHLIRMPVSLTPGEHTEKGYGAQVTVTVQHEFGVDFLAATFRNLVINDVVDLLSPVIYEYNRARWLLLEEQRALGLERARLEASITQAEAQAMAKLNEVLALFNEFEFDQGLIRELARFLLGGVELDPAQLTEAQRRSVLERTGKLFDLLDQLYEISGNPSQGQEDLRMARSSLAEIISGQEPKLQPEEVTDIIVSGLEELVAEYANLQNPQKFLDFAQALAKNAPNEEVARLGEQLSVDLPAYSRNVARLPEVEVLLSDVQGRLLDAAGAIRSPAERNPRRLFPVAPEEFVRVFDEQFLQALAEGAMRSRQTQRPRAIDTRAYIQQQASVAFDLMSTPFSVPMHDPQHPGAAFGVLPPLARGPELIEPILQAMQRRDYVGLQSLIPRLIAALPGSTPRHMPPGVHPVSMPVSTGLHPTLQALCWAIAVDAALLDARLREQVDVVFTDHHLPCPDPDEVRFYVPLMKDPEVFARYQVAGRVFEDYVRHRWPIITFALDPVTDQQNILDSFALRRDLQLALAFAFATGEIGFQQLNTFRRKIEEDIETIALNKTVTAFAHGNDTFGWRFYPRLQTPPTPNNVQTVANTLFYGGNPPHYRLRQSALEPGQRELTAVVIMPRFLRTVRFDTSGNWFKLTDPDDLKVTTGRMLEQGRFVQELRHSLGASLDAHLYRPEDVRVLTTKVEQLAAMLPMQSMLVPMPYDNTANGFELFAEGASALVPIIDGFEGADRVVKGQPTDLLLSGRGFSIHETKVVAGGRAIPDDHVELLSREVVRVSLAKEVVPTATFEGNSYVEVFLATPNGISNRLLVPYDSTGTASAAKADDPTYPKNSIITLREGSTRTFQTDDKGKPVPIPAPTVPASTTSPASGASGTGGQPQASPDATPAAALPSLPGVTAIAGPTPTTPLPTRPAVGVPVPSQATGIPAPTPAPAPDPAPGAGALPDALPTSPLLPDGLGGLPPLPADIRPATSGPILLPPGT